MLEPALTGERTGGKVTKVASRSSASQSGIQAGDIILEMDRKNVKDVADFQRLTRKI
ncbi:PDZ domain-containing protein [Candidatus Nitrospira salsa]